MKQVLQNKGEQEAIRELKRVLEERFRLVEMRIFGSKARGNALSDSDIDIMIELEACSPEIESAIDDVIFKINLAYDCFISAIIFSRDELEKGPLDASPLYRTILREGVRI
jgi:predicted nucleotidyltransferase